jgi:ABC-type glycerol-3-phosphate transport system substrate-binding protein
MRGSSRYGVLILCWLLLLAACDGAGESASSPSPAGGTASPTAFEGTLTIWDFNMTEVGGDRTAALQELDRQFMEMHPAVEIKHVGLGYGNLLTKARAMIAAQTGPDVITLYPGAFSADFRRGLIPLDDYITEQQREELLALPESYAPDGHIYAMPHTLYGYTFEYNKDLFRQAGLDPEAPPQTWSELLDACAALRAANITPMTGGWKDGYLAEAYFIVTSDHTLTNEEFQQFIQLRHPLTSASMTQAFQILIDLTEADCLWPNPETKTYGDGLRDFQGGKGAMYMTPSSDLVETAKILGEDNLGVFLFPSPPGSHYERLMDAGPNSGLAITSFAENPDLAYAYISFLLSKESQQTYWDMAGQYPNVRGLDITSPIPAVQEFLSYLDIPDNRTTYMAWVQSILGVFEPQSSNLFTGRIALPDLLAQMEAARLEARAEYE